MLLIAYIQSAGHELSNEQNFPAEMFIMLYKVVSLWFLLSSLPGRSNESFSEGPSCGADVCYVVQDGSNCN